MKRLKAVFAALALITPTRASAAEPYIIMATEAQLAEYDYKLEQYFSIPPLSYHPEKYLTNSKNLRRVNGQSTCSMLTAYPVKDYLDLRLKSHYILYAVDNPRKLREEISYTLGVAVTAVETICPEHKAELTKYLNELELPN